MSFTDNIFIIQPWNDPVFTKHNIVADALRLDLLHATISGNKWLKLAGYMQKVQDTKKAGILTKGGPWSNHAHACAYACKLMNLSCDLWIKGNPKQQTATLEDCKIWGASIEFVNRTAFYDEITSGQFAAANNLLYIPLGGAEQTGIDSVTAYLQQQNLPTYSHAVCAVGTATTFAGIAFVLQNFTNITGIESGTGDEGLSEKIAIWQAQLPAKRLQLLHQYHFGGYAKYDENLLAFMRTLYFQHGFPTDLVYTAKMFYAVKDLATKGYFPEGSRVLIFHSGGLQGNRSLPDGLLPF